MSTAPQSPVRPSPPRWRVALLAVGATLGASLGVTLAPRWAPAMAASLRGTDAPAYWYLSRASGLTAYVLLWLSVTAGLLSSTGVGRRLWRGPRLHVLHRQGAWLGLAFAGFHALVLLGDSHVGGHLGRLLVPFAMTEHAPGWVGLGQLALYAGALVASSFRYRGELGARTWRALHFSSFTVYALVVAHALLAGTDAVSPWIVGLFAGTGAIVGLLTLIRLLQSKSRPAQRSREGSSRSSRKKADSSERPDSPPLR